MKRTLIILAWIAGATVPAALSAVFVFGCCVLPFHRVIHRALPLCRIALPMLTGDDEKPSSTPAPERREPTKRIVSVAPHSFRLHFAPASITASAPTASTSYRSFIAHGATRCESDVGLHLLVSTLRI
jgi:hypothetical protein